MSSICTRWLVVMAFAGLVVGCADLLDSGQSNNTCFSTVNLSAEQHGWFVEAAEDWNWYEDREAIAVDNGCKPVKFRIMDEAAYYDGRTIWFYDTWDWTRCDRMSDFGSDSRHEMGHALGYCRNGLCADTDGNDPIHSSDPNSLMNKWAPVCATLGTVPP